MDTLLFSKMLSDKNITNFKKMSYKYEDNLDEFINTLKQIEYKFIPLNDFKSNNICYLKFANGVNLNTVKLLCQSQNSKYGKIALENEIIATNAIEDIDFNRDSVRNILNGLLPADESEERILGIKRGFEFIADKSNKITEKNIYKLYQMTIGEFLSEDDKLVNGNFYRHDSVYIMSDKIEHTGIDSKKLNEYMSNLVKFINQKDDINDLIKAVIIHFYIGYLHPYFDGNGRMARLIHLWYLIQQGYTTALFIPFSKLIKKNKNKYYNAYTLVEENAKYLDAIDVTPFILFFKEYVYDEMSKNVSFSNNTLEKYKIALEEHKITSKEDELWHFILSNYAENEFTSKKLEKDFGNAAYATIYKFLNKFTTLELLNAKKMSNKTLYSIK